MTDSQAKDACLQSIWIHRQRVLLPSGESFILTSCPANGKGKKLRATWSLHGDQDTMVEFQAEGMNAEQVLISCMEEALSEVV